MGDTTTYFYNPESDSIFVNKRKQGNKENWNSNVSFDLITQSSIDLFLLEVDDDQHIKNTNRQVKKVFFKCWGIVTIFLSYNCFPLYPFPNTVNSVFFIFHFSCNRRKSFEMGNRIRINKFKYKKKRRRILAQLHFLLLKKRAGLVFLDQYIYR